MLAYQASGGRHPINIKRSYVSSSVGQSCAVVPRPIGAAIARYQPSSLSGASHCITTSRRKLGIAKSIFSKFSEQAIRIIVLAQQQAKWLGFSEVGTEHVLLGMVANENEKAGLFGPSLAIGRAQETVQRVSGRRKDPGIKGTPPFTRNARLVFEAARTESQVMGMPTVTPEHICLAMCNSRNTGSIRVLLALGIDVELVKREARRRIQTMREADAKKSVTKAGRRVGKPAYMQCCRDLTEAARNSSVDPVIGRTAELSRVCQILARRKKNNPLLLGEPGVGKTAVAEGLAYIIAKGIPVSGTEIPPFLKRAKVLALDIALLLAGAKERGELESRLSKVIAEISASKEPIILFVDELHTAVSTGAPISSGGSSAGGPDISSIMRPALARGDLRCMAASTTQEYRKRIESDPALARCFQPVDVHEPSSAEAQAVLQGLVSRYEAHHRVSYTSEAIAAAVRLSERHIPDRRLPDKAIDLLDEAGSRARIESDLARSGEADIHAHHRQIELSQVVTAKEEAVEGGLYEEAGLLRERELDLKAVLVAPPELAPRIALVDTPDIEHVLSEWTGIPAESLAVSEAESLALLGDTLSKAVVGQEAAVAAVSKAVQRSRVGLKDPSRPQSAMLFAGPSGVGKTCLANELANILFHSKDALVRIDMSECMERHSVSKLIGAPPGYQGFGDGGALTEAVRRQPHCIVLFDEIEKAHPDVFNLLLQVMEDGRLTDSSGRVVSFKQALIILTSNIGSHLITKGSNNIGFAVEDPLTADSNALRSIVLEEMKAHFRPEFLNRLDDIVVFNKLQEDSLEKIACTMLAEVAERVSATGIRLQISKEVPAAVTAAALLDPADKHGARGLRRAVSTLVEDSLTELILEARCDGTIPAGDPSPRIFAAVDVVGGEVKAQLYESLESEDSESEPEEQLPEETEQGISLLGFPWIGGREGLLRKALTRVNV